uniref:NPH3 domain-containing protein n=2 Tax=Salix viminalis TaxID=40686 RepID=A0A6N2L7S5_SALVM
MKSTLLPQINGYHEEEALISANRRENEALRSELMKMKLYVSDMQKNQGSSTKGIAVAAPTATGSRKHTFFSSMSKTLGKLNPFKHGSKDTFHIDDNIGVGITKPRRRRFSIYLPLNKG